MPASDEDTLGLPLHANSLAKLKPKLINLCETYGIEFVSDRIFAYLHICIPYLILSNNARTKTMRVILTLIIDPLERRVGPNAWRRDGALRGSQPKLQTALPAPRAMQYIPRL